MKNLLSLVDQQMALPGLADAGTAKGKGLKRTKSEVKEETDGEPAQKGSPKKAKKGVNPKEELEKGEAGNRPRKRRKRPESN